MITSDEISERKKVAFYGLEEIPVAKVEAPNNILDLIDDKNARRGTGKRMKTGNRAKRWEGAIWKKLGRK